MSPLSEDNTAEGTEERKSKSAVMTLAQLRERREEILRVAEAYGASNVRVFGSVARSEAAPTSDVDLLLDIETDQRGFAYFGLLDNLQRELERVIGCPVDVGTDLQDHARESVLRDIVPL